MSQSRLEHLNITVSDPLATANFLCDLFGWHIRWQGEAIHGGLTVHVGADDNYLALFSPKSETGAAIDSYHTANGLNHIGIVVDDLDEAEARVKKAGFEPRSHADYEPGRRFYFDYKDGVEFEIINYD